MKNIVLLIGLFSFMSCYCQNGPGGVGNTSGNSILQLWLKADSGVSTSTNGKPVSLWSDYSGAGNDVKVSGNAQPTYKTSDLNGLPGIYFGGSHYLQAPASSSFSGTRMSMAIVVKDAVKGATICISDTKVNNEFLLFDNTAYLHRSSGNFVNNEHHCASSIPKDSARIVFINFDGVNKEISYHLNGLLSTSSNNSAGPGRVLDVINRKITLGQRLAFTSQEYLTGTIYEVIAFNDTISTLQKGNVESYLRNKYNINNNGCGNFTATNEITLDNAIEVFPNPAFNKVNIKFGDETVILGNKKIELLNSLGQVINKIESSINSNSIEVDLSDLSQGLYYLRVSIGADIIVKKIIKE